MKAALRGERAYRNNEIIALSAPFGILLHKQECPHSRELTAETESFKREVLSDALK